MNQPSSAIRLTEVSKSFGTVLAVDRVSFDVLRGQIACLLGPSGCGKTTTLRLIAGFEFLDGGEISISGRTMTRERPYERNIGLLFQDYALFPHMTVLGNVCYGLKHRGYPKERMASRADEMLQLVKLTGFERRYPGQLSGGQQQRVALARALATDPELLLLDEPLSALDAKLRDQLRVELKDILAEVGTTTIVVTHDQEEAMSLGDSIIVMEDGRISQKGTPREIYARPANRFVAGFVGRSNWVPGKIFEETADGFACVRLGDGGWVRARRAGGGRGVDCDLFVRPEHLTLAAHGQAAAAGNELRGHVHDVSLLGADIHIVVDVGMLGKLTAITTIRSVGQIDRGDPVAIRFDPADCLAFPRDAATPPATTPGGE
jgi:putative spermidine/putrescine transport system ATP-binding protein/putrescine transport system ATP-binding protein